MNQHLSTQQIDEWVIGERTVGTVEHLRVCRACAGEVARVTEPLALFGSAVRSWSEVESRRSVSGVARWRAVRLAMAVAALLAVIAVPVYHREEMKRQATQDEILLRQVESGIARSVPAPLEPLAKLMSNDSL